ncbi:MAG TPA: hypothetical protein VIM55_15045 [Mucilaginibacter sp.]
MKKTFLILLAASAFGIRYCEAQTLTRPFPKHSDWHVPPDLPWWDLSNGSRSGTHQPWYDLHNPVIPVVAPPPLPPLPGVPSTQSSGPNHLLINTYISDNEADLKSRKDKTAVETLNIP